MLMTTKLYYPSTCSFTSMLQICLYSFIRICTVHYSVLLTEEISLLSTPCARLTSARSSRGVRQAFSAHVTACMATLVLQSGNPAATCVNGTTSPPPPATCPCRRASTATSQSIFLYRTSKKPLLFVCFCRLINQLLFV